MNDNFIDSIAAWGKFGVENSGRSRDEKEWAKSGIDCLSSILKLIQKSATPTMSVMGLDIEQIRNIKQIVEQYAIEKVVLFPYPDGQNIIPLINVYGGDREGFFQYFGLNHIHSNPHTQTELWSNFNILEKEYGIILYENILKSINA